MINGAVHARAVGRLYWRFLQALAAAAGAIIAAVLVLVVYDVVLRNIGFRPPAHTIALAEYGMLYVTMLGAPWLLRLRGHVYIEMVIHNLPPAPRRVLEKAIYVACLLVCAVIAWYAGEVTVTAWTRGDVDIRSFDMPRWAMFAIMPLSFALMGAEFVRYLIGPDSMYAGGAPVAD